MRPCVPFASASEPVPVDPSLVRVGGPRVLAFAALATAVWLAPFEASAQHFYAGIGYGLERAPQAKRVDDPCSGGGPASSRRCATVGGRAPLRLFGDFSIPPSLAPGPGPATSPAERDEGLAAYRPDPTSGLGADGPKRGERKSMSRLLAASVDLPAIGTPGESSLSPFLGGGFGAVRSGTGETRLSFADRGGASRIGSAWMVTAGMEASLDARTTVGLAWRYTHPGAAETGQGSGRVEWRDRGRPIPNNLAPTSIEAKSHGVRLSLRYGF